MTTLRLIFQDQLSLAISSLEGCDKKNDLILMAELQEELTNVGHHRKKIVFLLSALRHFVKELEQEGYRVLHFPLGDQSNPGDLSKLLTQVVKMRQIDQIIATHPGDYRVLEKLQKWGAEGVKIDLREDRRYFSSIENFKKWAGQKKALRMEYFYRDLRRQNSILMDADQPAGGEWNYDAENRKSVNEKEQYPKRPTFKIDAITKEVIALVEREFKGNFGEIQPFQMAVTRKEALGVLRAFIQDHLPKFGDYQDAMAQDEPYLYHSVISYYLNTGLLLPREVCEAAERALRQKRAPLNSVEGFIRQILGWREFIRGIYWLKMPHYGEQNFLNAKQPLPPFYWDGKTDMNCVHRVVEQTRENAYSHHIQRLMVTGNFALLAGLLPKEVCAWYLAVYADAHEWVELPNTLGMSLFGDGGVFASKPYTASGKYINRMSNFCKGCRFDPNQMTGEKACPFNSLYWHFLWRHREKLEGNMRMKFAYATLRRMKDEKKEAILKQATEFIENLPT